MGRRNICIVCGGQIPKSLKHSDTCNAQCKKKADAADQANRRW